MFDAGAKLLILMKDDILTTDRLFVTPAKYQLR